MRVLYLSSSSDLAGAETCLLRLITELKKNTDHQISVISYKEGQLTRKFRKLEVNNYIVPSIHVKKAYNIREILKLIKNICLLRKILKREAPNIIHAFTIALHRRVFLLRLIGVKTPIIGTIHDDLTKKHFGYKYYNIIYSINFCFNKLITVSNATKDFCLRAGVRRHKLIRIYNGIPISFKKVRNVITSKQFTIGSFGRIVKTKGQHILIEAVKLLKDEIKDIRCFIIGSPPSKAVQMILYQKMLHEKVKKNKLEKNIIFIEWTNKINQYYALLDVYILASIIPDQFPTVNLEAMLYKKPVIAVNIGGAKEQVVDGETGFVIEPENPALLAKKILYLYKNQNERIKMGEAAYKRVISEFSMEKYLDRHIRFYRNCIKRS